MSADSSGPSSVERNSLSQGGLKVGAIIDLPLQIGTQLPPITIPVLVVDSRRAYGRIDWQIAPVSGGGSAWVREDTILTGSPVKVGAPKGTARATYRGQGRKKGLAHREHRTEDQIRDMRARGVRFEGDPEPEEE